jgi:hypothetical protein
VVIGMLILPATAMAVASAQGQEAPGTAIFDAPITCTVRVDSVLNSRFPPTRLFDGVRDDPASRWASSRAAVPHWVTLELDRSVVLDGMAVYGHDDTKGLALADAAVQVREGGSWKTLATVRDNRKARIEFSWNAVATRVIRLWISRPCRLDHTARLFEIVLCRGDTIIPLTVGDLDTRSAPDQVDDACLLSSVVPLVCERTLTSHHGKQNQALLQRYYDSVFAWSRLLGKHFQAVPGHPEWGYYGDGGDRENSVRPICYAALTNAFLAEIEPPNAVASHKQREQWRQQAIAALGYLTHAHRANNGACLNGKPWGNGWQSAMWARSLGMAGWLLWGRLDRAARLAVARVVEYEADRFLNAGPKSSLKNDTGAEENAWNAGLVALARCMMPNHPRADQWDAAAKRYMYNTFSVAADTGNQALGDDGRPICEWVTTVNAHPDYTVENHGLVHIGYLKNSHALLLEAASPYVLIGRPLPRAGTHHADDVFEVLVRCTAWDGAPIYFGGNDWKLVHTQCSDVISFALTNVLLRDARAAYLESVALDWLCRIQRQHNGYYTVRKDLEHNGFVASRLATCYLIRARAGPGVEAVSEQQFAQSITGVTHLEHGQAILHRTPSKFVSFAWGSKRMALAMPRGGNWVVWPHYASYLGRINQKNASSRNATLTRLQHDIQASQFTVTGMLQRQEGRVTQDFAIASVEGDVVVYIEHLRVGEGFCVMTRETGVVGHEYPLDANTRSLYGRFGRKEVIGLGNKAAVRHLETDWLNVGGYVGYVVCRNEGRRNVMRYHDYAEGQGRVPKLQEWFSLIGEADSTPIVDSDWACIVTFLNHTPEETSQWANRVRLEVNGGVATCRVGSTAVRVDFAAWDTRITEVARRRAHANRNRLHAIGQVRWD